MIREELDDLRKQPFQGKPLAAEFAGLWSLPVVRHRIIYQPEAQGLTVVYIGPARDVYDKLWERHCQRKLAGLSSPLAIGN